MLDAAARERLLNWWEFGEQKKPLITASICKEEPPLPDDLTIYWEDNRLRFNLLEQRIKATEYFGVAAPYCFVNFGSSCMAGMYGCRMRYINHETIWPAKLVDKIEDVAALSPDEDGAWYGRVYDYLHLALARDDIMTACYALEGVGDVAANIYGDENLLVDMLEQPDKVKSAFEHIKQIWLREYEKQTGLILGSGQTGMCGWSGIWAPGGTFPLQEDMSYMISPELFNKLCLPVLTDIIDAVDYPMYHLDGGNALGHLESLLQIKKLKAIQWVPGTNREAVAQWYPVYKRILGAGKSVQIYARANEIEGVVGNLGTRGVLISVSDASYDNLSIIQKYM